ncbi:STAS domain-containing protein [Bacillus tianshenii]|nr:STAS domain-containing protein [Bacillus tianshenii]
MTNFEDQNEVRVNIERMQQYEKIAFSGKLIYGNTSTVKAKLQADIGEAEGYILNMEKVMFIDSTGFGVLINLAKHLKERTNKIVLVISNDELAEYFTMAKFHLLFPIVHNDQEAFDKLQNDESFQKLLQDY